jgi:hypothetical protein
MMEKVVDRRVKVMINIMKVPDLQANGLLEKLIYT